MRALCLSWIDRYRDSRLAERSAGCCRFSPTCSHYAEDVLRNRAVPVALLLIAFRVLRCRRPLRATTRRKIAAVLLLSGIVTLGTAGLAQAVTPPTKTKGGCDLALSGSDVRNYHRNAPLRVTKGSRINAVGLAPQPYPNNPDPPNSFTDIAIDLEIVAPFQQSFKGETHKGLGRFNTSVNVDKYLDLGSGLYRINMHASGLSNAKVVWTCKATFYVRLDGNNVPGLIAGGLTLVGLGGAATASGKSDWQTGDVIPDGEGTTGGGTLLDGMKDGIKQTVEPDKRANINNDVGATGCLLVLFAAAFGYEPEPRGIDALAAAGLGGAMAPNSRRIYRRGHMVRGFVSGLLMGISATIFMQQRGYWLLTWMNVIVLPLGLALVFGWRGWRGKAFVVTSTTSSSATPPSPPLPAAPPAPAAAPAAPPDQPASAAPPEQPDQPDHPPPPLPQRPPPPQQAAPPDM